MHRLILNLDKELCDHKDGNGLNNQRNNIRAATKSQNNMNKIGRGSSSYLGVYIHKKDAVKKWRAQIKVNDKKIHIGVFEREEDAALAYNKMAIKYHKEFANLNIIK